MTERVDCIVVGAGVVGLAIAARMAEGGLETLVLERELHIGTGTSSRNSEVIHAGIYYPVGSLKARLCVEGRTRLYEFCASHGVPHRRCGKLIVANSEHEFVALKGLEQQARRNGVEDLRWLDRGQARALEPELECLGALLSPSTGIIDSHQFMVALQGRLEAAGGMVAFDSGLRVAQRQADGYLLHAGREDTTIACRVLINSAGLAASTVARAIDGLAIAEVPPTLMAKGNYFALSRRSPFSRLIYPAPESAGLGVHLTLDMAGQAKFGPDVEWITTENYEVDPGRSQSFYASIRRYWPGLPDGALQPAYAGIRPKLQAPGEPARDFEFQGPSDHGLPGLVNLYGIESPGLTSSLAIAEHVWKLLEPELRTGANRVSH